MVGDRVRCNGNGARAADRYGIEVVEAVLERDGRYFGVWYVRRNRISPLPGHESLHADLQFKLAWRQMMEMEGSIFRGSGIRGVIRRFKRYRDR